MNDERSDVHKSFDARDENKDIKTAMDQSSLNHSSPQHCVLRLR